MIRTNIQSAARDDSGSQPSIAKIGNLSLAMLCLVAGTALAALLKAQALTPLEILLWRPLLVLSATLFASVVWAALGKKAYASTWQTVLGLVPVSCVGAILVDLVGYWPKAVLSSPLPPLDALKYLATLGFSVTGGGPEGFLRGLAWALAAGVGVVAYRERRDLVLSMAHALAFWLAVTLVWMFPSFILWIAVGFVDIGALVTSQRMLLEFSRLTLGSYWINLQLLRWFTGFGEQLAVSYGLFAAAWIWTLSAILWSTTQAREWWRETFRFDALGEAPFLFLAAVVGLTAAWSRGGWSALDLGAWTIWIGLFLMLWSWRVNESGTAKPKGFWWLAVLGAGILGWPVLMAGCLACAVEYCVSHRTDLGIDDKHGSLLRLASWLAAAVLSFVFVRRGIDARPDAVRLLAASLFWLAPVSLALGAYPAKNRMWWNLGAWLAAAALSSLALWTFAPMAAIMLAAAVYFMLARSKPELSRYLPWLMYLLAWILLISLVWIPRLLNPRLVPMT